MVVSQPCLLGLRVGVFSKLNGEKTVNVTVATTAKVSANFKYGYAHAKHTKKAVELIAN